MDSHNELLPNFEGLTRTELKREIDRQSNCYICPFKYNCNSNTRAERRCIPHNKARVIKKAIDYAADSIRAAKKEQKRKEEQIDEKK